MKYIIAESKLEESILYYINELFDVNDINWTYPLEYDDETGEEWEDGNRVVFYLGDYDADEDEFIFKWYNCDYFDPGSHGREICPWVIIDHPYERKLNGYFGDLWKEPFKQWFTEQFDLPVNTVDE